jgi:hypothetical protein
MGMPEKDDTVIKENGLGLVTAIFFLAGTMAGTGVLALASAMVGAGKVIFTVHGPGHGHLLFSWHHGWHKGTGTGQCHGGSR